MHGWSSFLHAAYRRCKANNKLKLLLTVSALVPSNAIGFIAGTTGNYRLSFNIVPAGTVANWGNILHFTTTGRDCCDFGSRSPAIWFWPGTTRLHYRIGDSTDGNWGIDTDALPLNTRTKVTLECKGIYVKLTVGATVYTAKQPTSRFAGNFIVYASNPWYPAANAEIYDLDYQILPAIGSEVNAGKTPKIMITMA